MAGRGILRMGSGLAMGQLGLVAMLAGGRALAQPADHVTFASSDQCIACHSNLTDAEGGPVSIGHAWRGSMMAHSARDPYWQASVRREVTDHPEAQARIEDTCSTCHMPMARVLSRADGGWDRCSNTSRLPHGEKRAQRSHWMGCPARPVIRFRQTISGWSPASTATS